MKTTAIVTGGSRGIGLAIALELGRHGYEIAIVATRTEESYPDSVSTLREAGIDYAWYAADLGDSAQRQAVLQEIFANHTHIGVLVNNAGVAPRQRADLLEMTEESYDYVMNTNTKANMFITQAVAKHMMKSPPSQKKRGTIINISSCSATVSSVNRGEYCVSKAGIAMLTTLYADRLAAEGIFVYEIRPGVIRTDMTSTVESKYDALIAEGVFPIARWGEAEDVAKAVRAYCSDDFNYSTGNYIDVDGGFHIRRL